MTTMTRQYARCDYVSTETMCSVGPWRCIFCDTVLDGRFHCCEGLNKAMQEDAVEKAIGLLTVLGYMVELPKDSG
jgi:hypothetical protein